MHGKIVDVADEYGCGIRIDIEGKLYPHFSCLLHQCDECIKEDYEAPRYETECVDEDEMISYTRFTNQVKCKAHGAQHIQSFDTRPYERCMHYKHTSNVM